MDSVEHQHLGEHLSAHAAALRLRSQELAGDVSAIAGQIAQTEDEVARVLEALAGNDLTPDAARWRERAERARRFAEHERREQQRWFSVLDRAYRASVRRAL